MRSTPTRALTYAAAQAARVAFYGAHYLAARMMAREIFSEVEKPTHPLPSLTSTLAAMRDLFVQDWKNVEAGFYPAPVNIASEFRLALGSARFLVDAPRVVARNKRDAHDEVRTRAKGLPGYYQQNFHFQTDGYLSDHSARLYDFQVEALFAGTADAMRRRAWVPVARFLDSTRAKKPVLLDIGAGTGAFLSFVKFVRPDLRAIALDLSEPYLARAKDALQSADDVRFIAAPAEAMPLPDSSIDAATSIFLFHELPPKVRLEVAGEIARVLKPGGIFVLAETVQYGDAPDFDGLLDVFPSLVHEPYYDSYVKTDLDALFATAGLKRIATDIAYLTKIAVFEKPHRPRVS
ncbi:MAG TPA: class I SAM-dependent methyltransferase [Rhizomicrobium sp.]|jgi:ubiquinone/menaquinone biosynthesis C-methylase UbiE|nr:class I SAM-dependent methyltransferase [Rhizomicrobium sp.]